MTKLHMRPTSVKDVDHIMGWVNDPDVVKNLQHFTKRFTRADEVKYVKKMAASKNDFLFSFFTADGTYVGQGGIHFIAWENKLARFSLVITKSQWGKGYAQQAIKLLFKHAFGKLKLHKIWLVVWASNKKNIYLYTKLGFKKEGVLKEEYFWEGKYHDMIRMRMLAREFKGRGH